MDELIRMDKDTIKEHLIKKQGRLKNGWGRWKLDKNNLELVFQFENVEYPIPLDRCNNSSQILDMKVNNRRIKRPLSLTINDVALWQYLMKNNLSQNELGRRLGISSGYMAQLICGKRSPSPKLRQKMLEVLAPLTFEDLFHIEINFKEG